MHPEVSVLIAAYNANPFIARAIASVREQTCPTWEIVVVDDASTDETPRVVDGLCRQDDRIRLIRHERNMGPAAARNTALDAARGRWVAVLDADDAWRPLRLEKMLSVAGETGAEFIADNQILFDEGAGREMGVALDLASGRTELTLERLLASQAGGPSFRFGLLKPLILRSFIVEHGLRYGAGLRYCEDLHFYAQLLIAGIRTVVVAEPYYVYTCPVGSLSGARSGSSRSVGSVEDLLWVVDDLIDKHARQLTASDVSELTALKKRARERLLNRQITSLRHDRRFRELALLVLMHPPAAFRYIATSRTFKALIGKAAQRGS